VLATVILAHQGGWDEILLVAGPILVIVALLTLAKRRVEANPAPDDDPPDQRGSSGTTSR